MPLTLFERLRAQSTGSHGTSAASRRRYNEKHAHRELIESILHNLERLLNSRQGQSEACPDYGLMDMSLVIAGLPDSEVTVERAIQQCIERFEPRLTKVRVKRFEEPDHPLSLFFSISANLASERGGGSTSFETVVGPSGEVHVHHR